MNNPEAPEPTTPPTPAPPPAAAIVIASSKELHPELEQEREARQKLEKDLEGEKAARKKAETDAAYAQDEARRLKEIQSQARPRPAKPQKASFGFFGHEEA